ncbi:DPP IV N-terminal domain-containing protein [Streptomonospora sp. S1-112]|uniref:DPP IV N-terminal domain-containing protein n=1 Tax=Streptomonospora mangrovi TaxID=2883123 RepID=A0A9X3NKD0_9ACTN|nr:DPP IV N-terminal domain-containing protein [Streptomonospora mangrovi]MDA0564610.1 DPP IV N-terminal domain-containing protein [Streptomonospora mangrovi]
MPTFDTPEPIRATVDIVFGEVRFVAGDRADTAVEVRPADPAWDPDVRAAEQVAVAFADGRLTVRHPQLRTAFTTEYGTVAVRVELPAGSDVRGETARGGYRVEGAVGSCRLKTPSGDIRVERAAAVRLRTTGGAISVGSVAGQADISGNGDIRVTRLGGGAEVKTMGGGVWIGEAAGDLRVNSANGPITVDVARAAVNAKTPTGDIRLGELGGDADLYTTLGAVEVGVPHHTAADVDARTSAGRVRDTRTTPGHGARTVRVRARSHGGDIVLRAVAPTPSSPAPAGTHTRKGTTHMSTTENYQAAERLLRRMARPGELVVGDKVSPRWIDAGTRFWYGVNTPTGRRFVLVDPAAGTREPAFDHARLADALAAAAGQPVDPEALPFRAIEPAGTGVEFDAFGEHWRCDLATYTCERAEAAPPGVPLAIPSPDGKLAVSRRGNDLWGHAPAEGREWALTADGEPGRAYATNPEAVGNPTLLRKFGLPYLPPIVAWSPDSTRVLTHVTDEREVRQTHLVEARPADGGAPALHAQRYAYPGDENVPRAELVVLDVAAGTVVRAQAEPLHMPQASPIALQWAWWSADGSAVYYLSQPRDQRTLTLNRLDPATGEVTAVLSESGDTRVEPNQWMSGAPIVRVLAEEVLWYSQRDGWGHLYRYDLRTGAELGRVTSGEWAVREILHVDEAERTVYFTASGLVADDPYRRTVCRIGLDGSGFARITDDDLDHVVTLAPTTTYFIDSASTVDTPPVTRVRDWTGRVLVELERADITALTATGWTAPERFCVKAADGETDIYGVLYRPRGFDPAKSYPVVDNLYPGPQVNRVEPGFDPGGMGLDAEPIAALGFVVVALDGRGTPGRSKSFHDASYGNLGDAGGLDDHVAALRQLAQSRPWMDLDRVGAFGHSGGGYAAARAMLTFPEFFKVGVALSGSHEPRIFTHGFVETYDGADPESWARSSNPDIADRLAGKLLLVHGEMDDQVHPQHTLRLADRLLAAGKDFEVLIVPGAEHIFIDCLAYVRTRCWDFLVRELMATNPPTYRPSPILLDPELLSEMFA